VRTYGRVYNEDGSYTWVVVCTDANGHNDAVYLTTLVQVLKLNLNESPFYGNYGIPAEPSVMMQIFPDFHVTRTQQQFAPFFASLIVSKVDGATDSQGAPEPSYNINVVTHLGAKSELKVPV
jgi:hypothetical protein